MTTFKAVDFNIFINKYSATSGNGDYYYNLSKEEAEKIGYACLDEIQVVSVENPRFGVTTEYTGAENLSDVIAVFFAFLNQENDDCAELLDPNCPNYTLKKAVAASKSTKANQRKGE